METEGVNPIVHRLISSRFSPYAFSDQQIEKEKVFSLFEAARWAPSSFNEQPWRFIYAVRSNSSDFKKMLDCLVEANRIWAQHAAMLVLSIARMNFTHNNKPNRHAFHDVGLAVGNLLTQATSMGLLVHQMGGFSVKKARENLNIPGGFEPVAMIALGYHGKTGDLPGELRSRESQPRVRYPLEKILHEGTWQRE